MALKYSAMQRNNPEKIKEYLNSLRDPKKENTKAKDKPKELSR